MLDVGAADFDPLLDWTTDDPFASVFEGSLDAMMDDDDKLHSENDNKSQEEQQAEKREDEQQAQIKQRQNRAPKKRQRQNAMSEGADTDFSHWETALDVQEQRRLAYVQQLRQAGKRYETLIAAPKSYERAASDWMYALLFHYKSHDMDCELDAALAFLLEKYVIGAYWPPTPASQLPPQGGTRAAAAAQSAPPFRLHPSLQSADLPEATRARETAPGAPGGPDPVRSVLHSAWPERLPGMATHLPSRIREVSERKLFGDSRSLWFIRDTVVRLRALPSNCSLYKRFFLLIMVGMEPELQQRVVSQCPVDAFERPSSCDEHGRTFPQLYRLLSEQVVGQFNRFTAASVIRGYMLRVACTYDTGGVLR